MKKMRIYKNGSVYIDDGSLSIYPSGVEPLEVYDIDELTIDEIKQLKKNHKDKKLRKKIKKVKHG